jgi:hypothetical protein
MKAPDWSNLVDAALDNRSSCELIVRTVLRVHDTKYQTLHVKCNDSNEYAVKPINKLHGSTRGTVNDHIVAHLGIALGAPVGFPVTVEIPASIIDSSPRFSNMVPGITHATRFIEKCFESRRVAKKNEGNKERFALLAVLYGWVEAHDYAFLFEKTKPYSVYSVDHDEFFPNEGRTTWDGSTEFVLSRPRLPVPTDWVCQEVGLGELDLRRALNRLAGVTRQQIAAAVAAPLDIWGITFGERILRAKFLEQRRESMLA